MNAPNTNGQFVPAEGYPLLEVHGDGSGINDKYRPAGFTDESGDELTEADRAAYVWTKTDYASGPTAAAAYEANLDFMAQAVTLTAAQQATKAAYEYVKGSGHYLTPKPLPAPVAPSVPVQPSPVASIFATPPATVSEEHAQAVVAVQQTAANVAQVAVSLPSEHKAHSWLSAFFGFLAHNAVPVAAALIAANNPKYAPMVGAATEALGGQPPQ